MKQLLPLTLLPALLLAQPAQAQQFTYWWQQVDPDVPGDGVYQRLPPREYASRFADPDAFNERQYQLYLREMQRREGAMDDEDYPPIPPRHVTSQPQGKVIVPPYTASVDPAPPPVLPHVAKKVAVAPKPKADPKPKAEKAAKEPVSCDKGASIVSGYGFEKVTNKSCDATSLVYSAERGGKPFEIDVNPKTGELTAVKRL